MEKRSCLVNLFFGVFLFVAFVLPILFFTNGCGVLPPVISQISVSPSNRVIIGSTVNISVEAISSSGANLNYTWSASGGSLSSNSGRAVVWTAPMSSGIYTITLTVSDGTNSVSDNITIEVVDPDAPQINSLFAVPNPVVISKTSKITCIATDPNNLTLAYSWTSSSGTILSGSSEVIWQAPSLPGTYQISVTVTNSKNANSSGTISVEAVNPEAPQISNLSASASSVDSGGSITVTCYATDTYGLDLTYSWSASAAGGGASGTFSGNGNSVTWNAPSVTSTKDVTITVTVSNGSITSTKSITVTVRAD